MCVVGKCIGVVVQFKGATDFGLCESVSLFDLLLLLRITKITRKQDIFTSEWAFSSVCGRKQQLKEMEITQIQYYQHPKVFFLFSFFFCIQNLRSVFPIISNKKKELRSQNPHQLYANT